MSNTLQDMISPELRNIMEKYQRLGFLCERIGIETNKTHMPLYILDEIEKYKNHKDYEEIVNLCNKLIKIEKK